MLMHKRVAIRNTFLISTIIQLYTRACTHINTPTRTCTQINTHTREDVHGWKYSRIYAHLIISLYCTRKHIQLPWNAGNRKVNKDNLHLYVANKI